MANAATVKDLQAALTFLTSGAKALPEALSKPKVGIVCGSGLGGLVNIIREKVEFSYSDIPGFVNSTGEFRMCPSSQLSLSLSLPPFCSSNAITLSPREGGRITLIQPKPSIILMSPLDQLKDVTSCQKKKELTPHLSFFV